MYTISHSGQRVIVKKQGHVISSILLRDDLDASLDFLRKTSHTKHGDGLRTLETVAIYKNYSLWSFQQENLFWEKIRLFFQIQPVLDVVQSCDGVFVCDKTVPYAYSVLYRLFGVRVQNPSVLGLWKARCVDTCTFVFGFFITELTFLYVRVLKIPYLIYTPDKVTNRVFNCDFRFGAVYDFLKKHHISFVETFHTSFGKNFVKNVLSRKRPALYFEVYKGKRERLFSAADFDLSAFEGNARLFVQFLINDFGCTAAQHKNLIRILSKKLSSTHLKKLVAIDDVRYTNELIIACKENGIETVGIQHGHFTKYLVGWMNPGLSQEHSVTFDTLYVWNTYWKQVLVDYSIQYNDRNVVVGGLVRGLSDFSASPRPVVRTLADTTLLVLLEPWSPKEEVGEFIQDFLNEGAKILVSVRPDNNVSDVVQVFGLAPNARVEVVSGGITEDLVNRIDAVVGTYSTFLNEFLFYGKPVLLLNTSFSHGHRLVEDGLCFVVKRGSYEGIVSYINEHINHRDQVWPSAPRFSDTLSHIFNSQ